MAGTGIYGELLKAQLENLSSDPGSTSVGRVYWNTTTQSPRVYTSSGWDDLGGGGSGSSGRNYLSDWFDGDRDPGSVTNSITATGNITVSTTAWQASDTSKLTVARTSSSPLRQTYSILLDHSATGAAFVQTPCFLLDAVDLGKPVTVSFDVANVVTSDDYQVYAVRYNSGGTYQEQIPIAGTASATSPYSARIPTGTTKFQGFFIAGSTSTDYYVIRFYRNSASDTTDIKVDSLYAGPEKVVQGAAVTDWVSYTPTNSNSTNATTAVHYRRVGDSLELLGRVSWSGAGSGSTMTLTLPTGLTVDSSKIAGGSSTDVYFGPGQFFDSGTAVTQLSVYYASSTTIGFWFSSANVSFDGSQGASGDVLTFNARIPITGWSSNITMADRAVEEYASNSCTEGTTIGTTYSNTSYCTNGAIGSLFPNITTTDTTSGSTFYIIQFNTPTLPTDNFFIEFSSNAGASWNDMEMYTPNIRINDTKYGVAMSHNTSTTMLVGFGRGGVRTGATYGAASVAAWSTPYGANYRWRVRKVSGGAAVGYPISPANITKAIARYTTNAAQSIDHAGSGEVIDFEDKVFDTKNNVTTGASWKFTASEAGYYRVSATVLLNSGGGWAATEAASIMIRRSGTIYSRADAYQTSTHSTYVTCHVDDVVYLENGQYIDILIYQNSGGAITLFNSNDYNFVTIEQIM